MHIGEKIKAKRISLGWSQRELAQRMGYKNHSVVARVEAGQVDLPQSRLDQFAKVLGLSHAYLLGLVSEEVSNQNTRIAELVVKMRKDPEFFEAVSNMADLTVDDFNNIKGLLSALGNK